MGWGGPQLLCFRLNTKSQEEAQRQRGVAGTRSLHTPAKWSDSPPPTHAGELCLRKSVPRELKYVHPLIPACPLEPHRGGHKMALGH